MVQHLSKVNHTEFSPGAILRILNEDDGRQLAEIEYDSETKRWIGMPMRAKEV